MVRFVGGVLCAAMLWIAALPAAWAAPRSGDYILVTPMFDGIGQGEIVPVYLYLRVDGDRMEFRYLTSFAPDAQMCEMSQKCRRAVHGLTLPFAEREDGTIATGAPEFHTGDGQTIDRADVDMAHILVPTVRAVSGSRAEWSDGGLTLTQQGRRRSRAYRFVRGDLALLEDALGFAVAHEVSLARLDYCVVRQVVEMANKTDPTPAEADVLAVASVAGHFMRLRAEAGYYSLAPERFPGTEEEMRALREREMLMSVAMSYRDRDGGADDNLEAVSDIGRRMLGDRYEEVYDRVIAGREADILAYRRHVRRIAATMEAGGDLPQALCRSVLLEP